MKITKTRHVIYELEWYHGSLDWPCTYCKSNSYQNFHINIKTLSKEVIDTIVVCQKCLDKVKEGSG